MIPELLQYCDLQQSFQEFVDVLALSFVAGLEVEHGHQVMIRIASQHLVTLISPPLLLKGCTLPELVR